MKKILFASLGVIVLAVAGFYLYVINIDWSNQKDNIIEQIKSSTGKVAVFEGDVQFSVLPSPYLEAKNVKLFNDGEVKALAEIPSFIVKFELFSLLGGKFNITEMNINSPKLFVLFDKNGNINWSNNKGGEYDYASDYEPSTSGNLVLNSAIIKNAEVNITVENSGIDLTLKNLTSEITADGITGPYRFEGNFVENDQTIGFVVSTGSKLDGYATPLEISLVNADSETYLRFDGTMMPENNAIAGNILLEAKKPLFLLSKFMHDFKYDDTAQENPMSISTEIKSNKSRVEFSNLAVKYADSVGAGNIIIPFTKTDKKNAVKKQNVEISFEMTDLNFDNLYKILKFEIEKIINSENKFKMEINKDISLIIKSINTVYKKQNIQNFALELVTENNEIIVKNVGGLLPGNTNTAVRGKIYSENDKFSYSIDMAFISENFEAMLNWLGITPEIIAPSTYKNTQLLFNLSGTTKEFKFSPIKINMDKMEFVGAISFIKNVRDSIYLSLETDSVINLDNYLPQLEEDVAKSDIKQKIREYFKKMSIFNDYDIYLKLKSAGIILNKNSFGKTSLDADSIVGKMNIKDLTIENIYGANLSLNGNLSGFASEPVFENLGYQLNTDKLSDFIQRLGFKADNAFINKKGMFSGRGIINGTMQDANIKNVSSFGDVDWIYDGTVKLNENDDITFNGRIGTKSSDFSKFVKNFYDDNELSFVPSSLFSFEAQIEGNKQKYTLSDLEFILGSNVMSGNMTVDVADKPLFSGDLSFNILDLNQWIFKKDAMDVTQYKKLKNNNVTFLQKPMFLQKNINYDLFDTFNFNGKIKVDKLIYDDWDFDNFEADVVVDNDKIAINNLTAAVRENKFSGNLNITKDDNHKASGDLKIEKQQINPMRLYGSLYGFMNGVVDISVSFNSSAVSSEKFIQNLQGDVYVNVNDLKFKGWNLADIFTDLESRDRSDGLSAFVNQNMTSGMTIFNNADIEAKIKDGVVEFSKVLFSYDDYIVNLQGNINLNEWTIATAGNISFPTLKEIDNIIVDFSGIMASPSVNSDVTLITDKYDHYWQKIEEERERKRLEKEQKLKEEMEAQLKKLNNLKSEISTLTIPNLENMKNNVESESIKTIYQENIDNFNELLKKIDSIVNNSEKENVDPEYIKAISSQYEQYVAQVNKAKDTSTQLYNKDIKNKYTSLYDETIEIYKNSKELIAQYGNMEIEKNQYAKALEVGLDFEKDSTFLENRKDIEDLYGKIDKEYSDIMQTYYLATDGMSSEESYNFNKLVEEKVNSCKHNFDALNEKIKFIAEYMDKTIEEKNAEKNKPLEPVSTETKEDNQENSVTGTISTNDKETIVESGTNLQEAITPTVETKDVERKKFELKAVSDKNKQTKGVITKDGKNVHQKKAKTKRSFLRKVIGTIKEVSGSVTKN